MPRNQTPDPAKVRRAAASLARDLADETIHIAANRSEDARPWSSLCGSATGTILPTSLTATCPVCLRKAARRDALAELRNAEQLTR